MDLWDKLLSASIVEAISDLDTKADAPTYLSLEALKKSLSISNAKETSKTLNPRTEWESKEDSTKVLFTSLDKGNASKWLHQNLIIRDANAVRKPRSQNLFNNIQMNNQNIYIEEFESPDED